MKSSLICTLLTLISLLQGPELCAQELIPQPTLVVREEGSFLINHSTTIQSNEYPELGDYLSEHIERGYRVSPKVNPASHKDTNSITFTIDPTLEKESYRLRIAPEKITIRGADRGALFYAIQTLLQMMPSAVYDIENAPLALADMPAGLPSIYIEDGPRFSYRGVLMDVSRTFFDKASVIRYIDWLGRHKINKLHWHLTDDDGWRIEIKGYPELTRKGAWRGLGEALPPSYGSGDQRYGGFYTQDEVREIVAYAAFRNVEVIPEIDLPGHSRSITASYPESFCLNATGTGPGNSTLREVLCVGREENFEMLQGIFTELAELFPSSILHIGGDEVSHRHWKACSRCQALMRREGMSKVADLQGYFVERVEKMVKDLGKQCGAWNDVLKGGKADPSTLIYGWESIDACKSSLSKGFSLVAMPGSYCYIDMKQSPWERGHTWAGMVDARRLYSFEPTQCVPAGTSAKLLQGVEVALFAELMDRPVNFLEYQGYPRICALAEVGWSQPENRNWEDFLRRLMTVHFRRMVSMGIHFRVFPPDVVYRNGTIEASSPLAGTRIEYTTDIDLQNAKYTPYTSPIQDRHPERYLFRAIYHERYSPSIPPQATHALTLAPGESTTVELTLSDYIDRDGTWYLKVLPAEETQIASLSVTRPGASNTLIGSGQQANAFADLRIRVDSLSRTTGKLSIRLQNKSSNPNRVVLSLRPSPYLEPTTTVSCSLSFGNTNPLNNVGDYNMTTFARSSNEGKSGDYIIYRFNTPVDCQAIEIQTGLPNITRYIVLAGKAEYSTDGQNYQSGGVFDTNGRAILYPQEPIRSVRIKIEGTNNEHQVAFQDLRILPRY